MAFTTYLRTLQVVGTPTVGAPTLSAANEGKIYFDSTADKFYASENGGAYGPFLVANIGTTGQTMLQLTQPVNTTGSPTILRTTGGAHTTLTASAEASDVFFDLARTVQFATGALTTQRAVKITAPTYGFVGASTIADVATVSISAAPVLGANATFTRSFALWIETGALGFGALSARSGDMRIQHVWNWQGRNSSDASDRRIIDWGVTGNTLKVGDGNAALHLLGSAPSVFVGATERARFAATGIDLNNGTNANIGLLGNAEIVIGFNVAAAGVRNIAFFNDGSANMQSMDGGVYFLNAVVVPTGNPSGGGYMYATAGGGTWRGSGGTVTTFGPA